MWEKERERESKEVRERGESVEIEITDNERKNEEEERGRMQEKYELEDVKRKEGNNLKKSIWRNPACIFKPETWRDSKGCFEMKFYRRSVSATNLSIAASVVAPAGLDRLTNACF